MEWKNKNIISSFINKLNQIEIFKTTYIYKKDKKCKHLLKKSHKGIKDFPIMISINKLKDAIHNIEEIFKDKLITFSEKCNIPTCKPRYGIEFKDTAEFVFIILDYLYKDLNNINNVKIKQKIIRDNISCFKKFYEIIGFIIIPQENHFTSILLGNINDNEEYEYFYYNDMDEGNVIRITDKFENILKSYKIYLVIYRLLLE